MRRIKISKQSENITQVFEITLNTKYKHINDYYIHMYTQNVPQMIQIHALHLIILNQASKKSTKCKYSPGVASHTMCTTEYQGILRYLERFMSSPSMLHNTLKRLPLPPPLALLITPTSVQPYNPIQELLHIMNPAIPYPLLLPDHLKKPVLQAPVHQNNPCYPVLGSRGHLKHPFLQAPLFFPYFFPFVTLFLNIKIPQKPLKIITNSKTHNKIFLLFSTRKLFLELRCSNFRPCHIVMFHLCYNSKITWWRYCKQMSTCTRHSSQEEETTITWIGKYGLTDWETLCLNQGYKIGYVQLEEGGNWEERQDPENWMRSIVVERSGRKEVFEIQEMKKEKISQAETDKQKSLRKLPYSKHPSLFNIKKLVSCSVGVIVLYSSSSLNFRDWADSTASRATSNQPQSSQSTLQTASQSTSPSTSNIQHW
ncbi:hypothetical protein VP01_2903g2 [Puccinia sorghi]|uniref:Uncharacterized protein n=1 Tax=Puccinia sorghi TaxID=27349 RepID=A0A0L6V3B2_9BASI|nr:hypothetical protein VP01_2903g2 [Puccinia sorghi]